MTMPDLSAFLRPPAPAHRDNRNRLAAGLASCAIYAGFALGVWWSLNHVPALTTHAEISAAVLPERSSKRVPPPEPPAMTLLRPRAERPAPPAFTIATGAPPQAPAPLPASAATISPMVGGTSGNGTMGQAGGGTGGNGSGAGICLDPVWLRAVSERVRQFFYYPGAALAVHRTGVVLVHFAVRRDGRLERLEISKSSGDPELDQAAIDILRKAEPLPPIPERMHTERVDGELPVNFGVRGFAGGTSTGNC
ncbi:MAG: energy transducer TonB [Alphaproteobacteria bacterium]|nr:energy transducer TonB [Alphaproteobacteria bacterium]